MDERAVVIFDLDGTLVRGDSFSRFLTELLAQRPLRGVLSSLLAVPLLVSPRRRRRAANLWLWAATAGISDARYQQLVESYVDRHYHPHSGRPIESALQRLREHRRAGHTVVIVTGSEQRLAQQICHRLDFPDIDVVGTTLIRHRGALTLSAHCYGPAKLARLRASGYTGPIAYVYTDSSADLPLLTAATARVLVEPPPWHRRRIHATLGDCPVLEKPLTPTPSR
ncbi:HAD-IB family phosphatase [Nocardia crassostreae]|uniref:HAD-IB family phosphatase n=1 Tax=Nocardia crassostreae TaxID=53428 RepID=UPI000831ABFC|nr:HAD-IB family phosphatase [Nocardia crassostreae]